MTWYISKYARLSNGVELISYSIAPNFDIACAYERIHLPDGQFYRAEDRVGSLLPKPKLHWTNREIYSHKPYVAKMQADAESKAQQLIQAPDVDFAQMQHTMKVL